MAHSLARCIPFGSPEIPPLLAAHHQKTLRKKQKVLPASPPTKPASNFSNTEET